VLDRLSEVLGLDQNEASHDVLRFGEGSVRDVLLSAAHDLASGLERVPRRIAGIGNHALLAELLEPRHPPPQMLLPLLRGRRRKPSAKQIRDFAHGPLLIVRPSKWAAARDSRPPEMCWFSTARGSVRSPPRGAAAAREGRRPIRSLSDRSPRPRA